MRSCFVVFLSILFVPVALSAILFFNLNKTLLNPNFYKDGLKKADAYARVAKIKPEIIYQDFFKGNKEQEGITEEQIKILLDGLSPKVLQETAEGAIDEFFNSIASGRSQTFTLNVKPIKTFLSSKSLPKDLALLPSLIKEEYQFAVPREFLIVPIFVSFLPTLTIALSAFAAFFLIIALILKRGVRGRFRFLALLSLILCLFLALPGLLGRFAPFPNIAGFPSLTTATGILESIKNDFFNLLLYETAVLAGASVLLFIVSFFFERNKNKGIMEGAMKEEMNNKNGSTIIWVVLLVLALAGGGFLGYLFYKTNTRAKNLEKEKTSFESQVSELKKEVDNLKATADSTKKSASTGCDSTLTTADEEAITGWKTYENKTQKYSFKYPSTWTIAASESDFMSLNGGEEEINFQFKSGKMTDFGLEGYDKDSSSTIKVACQTAIKSLFSESGTAEVGSTKMILTDFTKSSIRHIVMLTYKYEGASVSSDIVAAYDLILKTIEFDN